VASCSIILTMLRRSAVFSILQNAWIPDVAWSLVTINGIYAHYDAAERYALAHDLDDGTTLPFRRLSPATGGSLLDINGSPELKLCDGFNDAVAASARLVR
jgi:hypothetical protein